MLLASTLHLLSAALVLFFVCTTAYLIYNVTRIVVLEVLVPTASVGVFLFAPLQFHFVYALFHDTRLPAAGAILLYTPAVAFAVLNFVSPFALEAAVIAGEVVFHRAWISPPYVAWLAYATACWIAVVFVYLRAKRSAKADRRRAKTGLPVAISAFALLVILGEYHLPLFFSAWPVPPLTAVILSMWLGGTVFVLRHEGFLRIAQAGIGHEILDAIDDLVLFYNMAGERVYANRQTETVLGTSCCKKETNRDPIRPVAEREIAHAGYWTQDEPVRRRHIHVPRCNHNTKGDHDLTLCVRLKPSMDRFGHPLGVVVTANIMSSLRDTLVAYGLTSREAQVAEHLIDGQTIEGAAQTLGIAERTVKAHITHIYAKTGAVSRMELATLCGPGRGRNDGRG